MIRLNDCQGWHTFRYISLVPDFLISAEFESNCKDMLLLKKKELKLQLFDICRKVHNPE